MTDRRAVVIPFGVPSEGRGLGIGLAALVHGFIQLDGQNVALAQVHSRAPASDGPATPQPVEAFVPPSAWRDLAGSGNAPQGIAVVLTGAFEPPTDGRGAIQLLAFDAHDGATRASVESPVDGPHAGAMLIAAFEELCGKIGANLGAVRDIGDLEWDALESVLLAERFALHDPSRGGPNDRLAAMGHLGRAVFDAPEARFPAGRLAAMALEAANAQPRDPKLAKAALRALSRASDDAPQNLDLCEAMAALETRTGDPAAAERRLNEALTRAPTRPGLYALLAEALRARGAMDAAMAALESGLGAAPRDPVLENERGGMLALRGDFDQATRTWLGVLDRGMNAPAFANAAAVAMRRRDTTLAQTLVDRALAAPALPVDVARRAVQLALASEPDGIARATRVAALAKAITSALPDDAWASLVLARASTQLGQKSEARDLLARVELHAPGTPMAAEAQRARFAIEEPEAALALEATLRAAGGAPVKDLEEIAVRAKRLATSHGGWLGWLAASVAERRAGRLLAAREAANTALEIAPGCSPAHAELASVAIALGEGARAVLHAEKTIALEGEQPRLVGLLARALAAAGRRDEAVAVAARAVRLDPNDDALKRVVAEVDKPPASESSWLSATGARVKRLFRR